MARVTLLPLPSCSAGWTARTRGAALCTERWHLGTVDPTTMARVDQALRAVCGL